MEKLLFCEVKQIPSDIERVKTKTFQIFKFLKVWENSKS